MKNREVTQAALALALAVPSIHAVAQTTPQSLGPVIVSAARIEQPLADALPNTSVITRDDIERSQAPDLLTLLARLPGVEVAQLGGIGSQTGLFLRGGETRHVLVLIDGVPMNNLNFSLASLDQIMTAQVERVEIVRGNVSSLYGSQAVGGVIQVFTRSSGRGVDARAVVGSRGTSELQADARGGASGWHYSVALSGLHTDGFNQIDQAERPGTNPDRDGYRNESASARIDYSWAQDQSLSVHGLRTRGRLQYDSEFGPATQADQSVQTIETIGATARNRLAPRWISQLSIGRLRDALDASVTAYPYFVTSTGTQVAWQNDIELGNWNATVAAERLRQTIDSDTAYDQSARTVDTLRAGLLGRIGPQQLQLNVRRDDYSDFGAANTGYAGYGYALSDALKLIASASTAFNAPTFNDLFYPYGGNPNLKPERTRSVEAGIQYRRGSTAARLQLFQTRYRDLIGFDSAFNRVNIGRATTRGAEFSLDATHDGWRAQLAVTLQQATDDDSGARLVRRARAFGNVALSRTFDAVDLLANLRATGDRRDVALGADRILGGYGVIDLALRWHVRRDLLLTLRIENALDHAFENAYGYRGAPRGAFGGVELQL
ncbi:MAG: TonB-dependent receptor domain-containing protein [Gemmatimonadota bacterium]